MKVLRLVGMALMAVLMCANFVACSNNEGPIPENPQKDKLITVGLKCTGEFLDITNSPLSRAEGGDEYHIQVFSLEEKTVDNGDDGSYIYMVETPYAYGIFESLDDATIKLLDGHKYKFQIAIAVGQGRDMEEFYNTTDFTYSSTVELNTDGSIGVSHEGFYGELDQYIPIEGGSVNIETKRVSYGVEFIAEGLDEGTLDITVAERMSQYNVTLTPNVSQYTGIHSFEDVIGAWLGKEVQTGVDEDGDPIYGRENYTNEVEITINWTKSDDNVTPLGTHKVVFERNVKTTIRIKVEEVSVSNGVTITRENTLLTDDDNEYVIEGGSVVEIPVGGTDN